MNPQNFSLHTLKMTSTIRSHAYHEPKKSMFKKTAKKMNLKLPKSTLGKIFYIIVIIPIIPLKITLPKYKNKRTIAKFFFGSLMSLLYITFFSFVIFIGTRILTSHYPALEMLWQIISNLPLISLIYYCYESPIINNYFFNTMTQEVYLIDTCLIGLSLMIFKYFDVESSAVDILTIIINHAPILIYNLLFILASYYWK